jgi:hypothetical protein
LAALSAALLVGAPAASGAVTATTPWAVMTTPHIAGTNPDDELKSVSCPTTKFCLAVGLQVSNTDAANPNPAPLAEVWTGKWKVTPTPNPAAPPGYAELDFVSCSSPSYCMAIGQTDGLEFGELWNGSTWTVNTMSLSNADHLYGLSCASTECVAVGNGDTGNFSVSTTLAEEWDGHSWSTDPTSVPGLLWDVSCFAASQCLAVGETIIGPALAQYFNAGVWSDVSPPNDDSTPMVYVGCVTASLTCTALSYSATAVWNESTGTWSSAAPAPNWGKLASFSCATTTWCVAVGPENTVRGETAPAVANAWNGSAWTVMNTKKLGTTGFNPRFPLNGVSCPTATLCVAVGFKQALNAQEPLAASWGTVPGGLLGL